MTEFKSRTVRGPDESQEHWEYRIFAYGFYRYRNPINNQRFWMDQWGPRPPNNEADYREPDDTPDFRLNVAKGHREQRQAKTIRGDA